MSADDAAARPVSVVIPTFNSSGTIKRTLESIDRGDAEILVIDDCSSDIADLKKILSADKRVRLIEKPVKTNAADSRAIGLIAASNDFVFFLDSDDRFEPGHIARRLALFAETRCSIIFGRFKLDDGRACRVFATPAFDHQDIEDYIFVEGGDCRSSTLSVDRALLNGTTFDRRLAQHQDWGFGIAMQRNNETIVFDPEAGVVIDIARPARMSAGAHVEASLGFLGMYLRNERARQGFLIGRMKAAIKLRNPLAASRFHAALRGERPPLKTRAFAWSLMIAGRSGLAPLLHSIVAKRK